MELSLLKPGSHVRIADAIPGTVSAVRIGDQLQVRYLVVWWDGRSRHEEWHDPHELNECNVERVAIGFGG